MSPNSNRFDGCTEKQKEVLRALPASTEELAERFGLTTDGVTSRIERARNNGAEVEYSRESGMYYVPGADAPLDDEAAESGAADPHDVVDDLRDGGLTYNDLAAEHDLSRDAAETLLQDLRETGYSIEHKVTDADGTRLFYIPDDRDKVFHVGDGDGTYTFALIGDTHLGSKAEHLQELHDFYDRVEEAGVDVVYHAGDITDGWKVHKGHIDAIKGEASGWNRLLQYTVENYPQRDGVDTLFIEGNHDRKYHRRNGLHLGEMLDQRRDDLHYCGDSMARFVFDEEHDIDMELIHPSGGKPYTAGYRLQTLYRERPVDGRPTIAGVGHLHGSLYNKTEGVHGFYVGAWKGTTTYGKRKGHQAEIGGWIVTLEIEGGEVRSLTPQWVGYESRDEAPSHTPEDVREMTQ